MKRFSFSVFVLAVLIRYGSVSEVYAAQPRRLRLACPPCHALFSSRESPHGSAFAARRLRRGHIPAGWSARRCPVANPTSARRRHGAEAARICGCGQGIACAGSQQPEVTMPKRKRKAALECHPLTPDRWSDLETLFGPRGACGGSCATAEGLGTDPHTAP